MTSSQPRRILPWVIVIASVTVSHHAANVLHAQNPIADESGEQGQPAKTARVQFSFERASWRSVIGWLAESGQYALHVNDLPLGSFTYSDDRLYTHDEAINRINMFLIPQRYTLVRSENLLSVISLVDENSLRQLDSIARLVTADELKKLGTHEFVKCLFPLEDIAPEHALEELGSLMLVREPTVLRNTNQLMVMDTAGKLRTVAKLLGALAKPESSAGPIKSFSLGKLDAQRTLTQIRPHVGLDPLAMTGPDIRLSIDDDRHQLLASGSSENVKAVANIILLLQETDVPDNQGEERILRTHDVGETDMQMVVNVLQTLLADEDVHQATDTQSNQLVIRAKESVHQQIEETIKELAGKSNSMEFRAIDVPGVDARYAAIILNDMFASRNSTSDDDEAVLTDSLRIDADPVSGRLFVRARKSQLEEIERAIQQFSKSSGKAGDKMRVLPYRGEKAQSLLDSAREFWPHDDSIEVIPSPDKSEKPLEREINSERLNHPGTPSQEGFDNAVTSHGPADRKAAASGSFPTALVSNDPPIGNAVKHVVSGIQEPVVISHGRGVVDFARSPGFLAKSTTGNASQRFPMGEQAANSVDGPPKPLNTPPKPLGDMSGIRVQITPQGMLIRSDDPAALERFEEHMQLITGLGRNTASDRRLQVFYLKHAMVDDANSLLRYLLSEDSFSKTGNATRLSRLSLPQTMKEVPGGLDNLWNYDSAAVIPDKRLNRFFVYGTDADLTKIEEHLQVIDRENSIARLNTHGTPRMIRLFHTDAEDVAAMIRDTYSGRIASTAKERSEAAANRNSNQAQRNSGNRPVAGEPGNGLATENTAASGNEGKMTLAVDEQSNSIVVTAPSQLADEVEKLAEAIDKEGRQMVHVIPIKDMDRLQVQESLKALFGTQIRGDETKPNSNPRPRTNPQPTSRSPK